jgi:hypothetical protein
MTRADVPLAAVAPYMRVVVAVITAETGADAAVAVAMAMTGMRMRGVPVATVAVAVLAMAVLVLRLDRGGKGEGSEGRQGDHGEPEKGERWGFHFRMGWGSLRNRFVDIEDAIFDEDVRGLIQSGGTFSISSANEYPTGKCVVAEPAAVRATVPRCAA